MELCLLSHHMLWGKWEDQPVEGKGQKVRGGWNSWGGRVDPLRGEEEAHGPLLLVALISPGISSRIPLHCVLSHSSASYSHPFVCFKKDLRRMKRL